MNDYENTEFEGNEELTGTGMEMFVDFDTDAEYKPDPLVPNGTYYAAVKSVKANPKTYSINWRLVLHDNDVMASDGETSVDGMELNFTNWLPKPGDENEFSKNGKSTKRQNKINMLARFAKEMKIDMSTPNKIAESIANATWVGLEVSITVAISEWKGELRNDVSKMIAVG